MEGAGRARREPRTPPRDERRCRLAVAWQEAEPIKLRLACPVAPAIGLRDPIPLSARAVDVDELVVECQDDEGGDEVTVIPLPDAVGFVWRIEIELLGGRPLHGAVVGPYPHPGPVIGTLEGAGGVRARQLPGDQVLYVPPHLHCGEWAYVVLSCTASNTPRTKIADAARAGVVALLLTRLKTAPSRYSVTVLDTTEDDLTADYAEHVTGSSRCTLSAAWDPAPALDEDPAARSFPHEVCPGESTVLRVRGLDADRLRLACGTDRRRLRLDDPVTATWSAASGAFPCGGVGEYVVYRAPPTRGDVQVICVLTDSGRQAPDGAVTVMLPIKVGWGHLMARSRTLTDRIIQIEAAWHAANDPRFKFAVNHACISEGVMAGVDAGRFTNPCWILRLNIAFMEKFLDALDAYEKGGACPPDWKHVFELVDSLKAHPIALGGGTKAADTADYVTLLMAGVHIFHDIALSLMEVGCGPEADFQTVMQMIDECETKHLGILKAVKQVGSWLGAPGANAISDWRNAVWDYVCKCGPHPSAKFP